MKEPYTTILFLDDDKAVRQSFVSFFKDRNRRVNPFEYGVTALTQVGIDKPHYALVDIRLPGISGDPFIRGSQKECPKIVCVICTGSPEYSHPLDIMELTNVCHRIYIKPLANTNKLETAFLEAMV